MSSVLHHLASGIHRGAFVQSSAPATVDVQDGVLWVDTSSGPPYQLKVWDQSSATWRAVCSVAGTSTGSAVDSTGQLHTACLTYLSHGATLCNPASNVMTINNPSTYTFDATGIMLPAGHRLEQVS